MKKKNTAQLTVGIDLGDRKHAICIIDHKGEVIQECMISNTREDIAQFFKDYPGALIAMEVGMHSPWLSRFLKELGHRVIVANPRKLRAIARKLSVLMLTLWKNKSTYELERTAA